MIADEIFEEAMYKKEKKVYDEFNYCEEFTRVDVWYRQKIAFHNDGEIILEKNSNVDNSPTAITLSPNEVEAMYLKMKEMEEQ